MKRLLLLFYFFPALLTAQKDQPNILMLVADDWSWPHASILGDAVVRTPTFDKLVKQGAMFVNAFVNAPSCTPSRAAILTGLEVHRLEEGSQLWGFLPRKFETYPDALEKQGYSIGLEGKGWGPGNIEAAGRTHNPAGKAVGGYAEFFKKLPKNKPFCFWYGSSDPHRPYDRGTGQKAGLDISKVQVPAHLPDDTTVRSDMLDYYFEVERFDRNCGKILSMLDSMGLLENTIVVMTSDNGMPFPRAKATLYDGGSRVPLVISWKNKIKPARIDKYVTLRELAPTFLHAAGIKAPAEAGEGLLGLLLTGSDATDRNQAFFERERHSNSRVGDLGYPARAVRSTDFLYIRNFHPERYPGGDPQHYFSVGPYGDIDASPSKDYLIKNRDSLPVAWYFLLAMAKRPMEELYDLKKDPGQLHNVASKISYRNILQQMQKKLGEWMQSTADPRARTNDDRWDRFPYYGKKVE